MSEGRRRSKASRSRHESAREAGLGSPDTTPENWARTLPDVDGAPVRFFAELDTLRFLTQRHFQRALEPFGLVFSEYQLLFVLVTKGSGFRATPQALNRIVQLTSPGLTRALDRLEAAGHVDRAPNPEDRRSVLVGLTEAGAAFATEVCRGVAQRQGEALAGLSARDRGPLLASMRALIETLSRSLSP